VGGSLRNVDKGHAFLGNATHQKRGIAEKPEGHQSNRRKTEEEGNYYDFPTKRVLMIADEEPAIGGGFWVGGRETEKGGIRIFPLKPKPISTRLDLNSST